MWSPTQVDSSLGCDVTLQTATIVDENQSQQLGVSGKD